MSEWQPIETLMEKYKCVKPDCDCGEVWSPIVVLGRWDAGHWRPWVGQVDATNVWLGCQDDECQFETLAPTHWMPLPEPPADMLGTVLGNATGNGQNAAQ